MKLKWMTYAFLLILLSRMEGVAQITSRERPEEWKNLVFGGRFMDRFLPIPPTGPLTYEVWGGDNVIPRYVDNGIEDQTWSYWGGNILPGDDGKYHLFVCRWREDSPKGHMEWPKSKVVHAIANHPVGPYNVKDNIGPGHNPEAFRLKDGRYVIYVMNGYYISPGLNGPWEYNQFEFNTRDRKIIEGLSNLTFARREDGSYLMICRGGGVWFSQTGISPYHQVTEKSVYPPVEGRFEDPVVWRTNIQYHLIVNDWYGRIAYYLRSKDGIHWKTDPGEAYIPGITKYEDGTVEDWFKYERIKVLQDEYGRAVQANFAVIDTLKHEDKPGDSHSSKNISIPLTVGRLIEILGKKPIDEKTKFIRVKVRAEENFNPHTDMDIRSLRFGAPEEINFGRGCTVEKTEKSGDDLIIKFNGKGNGITDDNFAAKLLGKTTRGKLLFGYARLPSLDYTQPALSARLPVPDKTGDSSYLNVEVQNFGQMRSKPAKVKIEIQQNENDVEIASGTIPELSSFQKTNLKLKCKKDLPDSKKLNVKVTILQKGQPPVTLTGEMAMKE